MRIETDRLILEPWRAEEWTLLRPMATDPEVTRYLSGRGVPWAEEKMRRYVNRQIELYEKRGYCRWKLTEKATGQMVGLCGVGCWSDDKEPEIGWLIAKHRWGCGLASEAADASLRDVFERLKLERMDSIASADNAASRRIMEKIGLAFEAEYEEDGQRCVRYSVSRETWARARAVFAADGVSSKEI